MFFKKEGCTKESITISSGNMEFNDSMKSHLLPPEKRRKDVGTTAYKRPGPPTPSKNGGRVSLQSNGSGSIELNQHREPLKECIEQKSQHPTIGAVRTTPGRLRALFTRSREQNEVGGSTNTIPPPFFEESSLSVNHIPEDRLIHVEDTQNIYNERDLSLFAISDTSICDDIMKENLELCAKTDTSVGDVCDDKASYILGQPKINLHNTSSKANKMSDSSKLNINNPQVLTLAQVRIAKRNKFVEAIRNAYRSRLLRPKRTMTAPVLPCKIPKRTKIVGTEVPHVKSANKIDTGSQNPVDSQTALNENIHLECLYSSVAPTTFYRLEETKSQNCNSGQGVKSYYNAEAHKHFKSANPSSSLPHLRRKYTIPSLPLENNLDVQMPVTPFTIKTTPHENMSFNDYGTQLKVVRSCGIRPKIDLTPKCRCICHPRENNVAETRCGFCGQMKSVSKRHSCPMRFVLDTMWTTSMRVLYVMSLIMIGIYINRD